MSEHRWHARGHNGNEIGTIDGGNCEVVCAAVYGSTPDEIESRRDFVILAVNSHADLVEALADLVEAAQAWRSGMEPGTVDALVAATISSEAALAKADSGCTCPPTCGSGCKGQCGCKACRDAYQDFLSME